MNDQDFIDPEKQKSNAPKRDGSGALPTEPDALKAAAERAVEAAREITRQFDVVGMASRKELSKVVRAFGAALMPRWRRGRKPRKEITAAYTDWKNGVRGIRLFETHIRDYARLSAWRREKKQKALMAAIRSRQRRDPNRPNVPTKCD